MDERRELGESPHTVARTKNSVSIFFSNIENYEHLRSSLNPDHLVQLLDQLFERLDEIGARHRVQRIDTCDGCYIAATNFLIDQPNDHAARLAEFALEAMAMANVMLIDESQPELGSVTLRAGIHCGTVSACLIGVHDGSKFTVVGDAVNVASRMASQGLAGAIQCSESVAREMEAQNGKLVLRRRDGELDLKGRGIMTTFWLLAK